MKAFFSKCAIGLAAVLLPTAAFARDNLDNKAEPAVPTAAEAPIALLVDVTSGQVLHERDADRRFVPASITKAMTTFLAFELLEEGNLDPRQVMTIRPETWREWSGKGSTMWLPADARVTVDEMLTAIANVSANDASVALAEGQAGSVPAWTAMMNEKARELGMVNSHFGTPNGWPDEGRTFTSARDLAKLADAMVARHPQKFARYVGKPEYRYNNITQYNRDPMIGRVLGADGIKTGYTNEAGFGFLGTAKRDGQRLVLVVAGVGSQSARGRIARSYIEWGFSAFDSRAVFSRGEIVANARVQGGSSRKVALVTDRPVFVNIPKGGEGSMRMSVYYDGPLRAPFRAGQRVATLQIDVEGMEPARIPLLAGTTVNEANIVQRLVNGFAGWFA